MAIHVLHGYGNLKLIYLIAKISLMYRMPKQLTSYFCSVVDTFDVSEEI